MTTEAPAAPRRHKLIVKLVGKIGAVIDTLDGEVESLEHKQIDSLHVLTIVLFVDQMGTVIDLMAAQIKELHAAPFEAQISENVRPFTPKQRVPAYDQDKVTRFEPKVKQGQSLRQVLLAVANAKKVFHPPDLSDALEKVGLSVGSAHTTIKRALLEGVIEKVGFAAYSKCETKNQKES
jgi:hypothetical protein